MKMYVVYESFPLEDNYEVSQRIYAFETREACEELIKLIEKYNMCFPYLEIREMEI